MMIIMSDYAMIVNMQIICQHCWIIWQITMLTCELQLYAYMHKKADEQQDERIWVKGILS